MGGTGRQKGKAQQLQETHPEQESERQKVLMNGKPKMNGSAGKIDHGIEKEENIFLFIPNVIGQPRPCPSPTQTDALFQVIHGSSSPSPLSTTCPSTREHAPSSTRYPASSMRSTE
jgi:hypothetical protein